MGRMQQTFDQLSFWTDATWNTLLQALPRPLVRGRGKIVPREPLDVPPPERRSTPSLLPELRFGGWTQTPFPHIGTPATRRCVRKCPHFVAEAKWPLLIINNNNNNSIVGWP
jgi:hypothetical protein